MMIQAAVVELLKKLTIEGIDIDGNLLETPQDRRMWDVSLPCFIFAKTLRKSPQQISADIAEKMIAINDTEEKNIISKIIATGSYINFFINPLWLANEVLECIEQKEDKYGEGEEKNEKLIIESPWPNTNKPLHLWHVRNILLGNSLAALANFAWYEIAKVDIVNDRGIHICKSMLAYQLWGENKEPNKKTDHFVWDRYVRYDTELKQDPSLEEKSQVMLQQRESGDKKVKALRKKMRNWALEGMSETYKIYDCVIDKAYYESDHYLKWKSIIEEGFIEGIFTKNGKGNIVFKDGDEEKTVLRSDGTSIYMTQDIALWKIRYNDWKMDRMVYVVGNEQEHHFIFLFKIFKALWFSFADKCYHLSYGMISLPDGKMKSREGNVVDADTLIEELTNECVTMLTERHTDRDDNLVKKTAFQIAMGAIKFFILKYDEKKDFIFDRKQSLSFDGESWPYIQYTIARCGSIIAKSCTHDVSEKDYSLLEEAEERILLVLLSGFSATIEKASDTYQPYLVARYILELAKTFNNYYQKHKIITDDKGLSAVRLSLVVWVKQVLKNWLRLLGIEAPEKM